MAMLVSSLLMQGYTEWNNFQLKRQAGIYNDTDMKGDIKRTGMYTFVVVAMIWQNLLLNLFFPKEGKNEDYFLCQDLLSLFLLCVILPIVIAATNPGMCKYIHKYLTSTSSFATATKGWDRFIKAFVNLIPDKKNQIRPIV